MEITIKQEQNLSIVELQGDLRKFDQPDKLNKILASVTKDVLLKADKLEDWDSTTCAAIYSIIRHAENYKLEKFPRGLKKLVLLALKVDRKPYKAADKYDFFEAIGTHIIEYCQGLKNAGIFLQRVASSISRLFRGKAFSRADDWFEAMANYSYKALGIVMLACFMTGLILAFVGSLQLRMFGAQVYIASLVTIAMVRIMGAIMMGVIIAGHSGAQMAAVIGSMKVNEELNAIKTFGFSNEDMVILPRLVSLTITCPFLTIFADIAGILGGMLVAVMMFDISVAQYWYYATQAFSLRDFTIGIIHGGIYGFIIAAAGCYFGINCGRDARSVGDAATKAVVSSIVIMIVTTGFLTWIIEGLGI